MRNESPGLPGWCYGIRLPRGSLGCRDPPESTGISSPGSGSPALPPSNPGSQSTQDAYRSTARAEVNNIVVVTPVSRSARHRGESTVSGQTPGESFLKRVSHGSILSGVRRAAGRDVPGGGTAHVLAPPELSEEAVSTSLAPSQSSYHQ
ncbi:Citrate synthase [Marssonina coronariae]|uniref:Citrate synthase n=1 Tax=Diplocarpon coronariae TaxID=2795749 RepID=A0A218YVV6_9HELO|nr:Citrate synthase [Marssonina coronariae]